MFARDPTGIRWHDARAETEQSEHESEVRSVRSYEVIFILDPALGDDGVEAAATAAKAVLTKAGGEVVEIQKWGKKRLAYDIKKRREGHYVYFRAQAPGTAVAELERHLKIAEPVLKYLTVLVQAPRRKAIKASTPSPVEATPVEA